MTKILLISLLALVCAAPALADELQSGRSVSPRAGTLNAGHITSTGETVPNPGASQSGGVTPLDRGINHRDDEITKSICQGC